MRRPQHVTRRQFLAAVTPPNSISETETVQAAGYTALIDETGIIPNAQFQAQYLHTVPAIAPEAWSLTVAGLVETPLVLSYEVLLARSTVEIPSTLACSGHSADRMILGHAVWQGVWLRDLLADVTLQPDARWARFGGADGYATSIALDELDEAFVALGMNGTPLAPEHGFPARLIVPGLYGYKLPKWMIRIELTAEPYLGFWERRGWSQQGAAQITSVLLYPQHDVPFGEVVRLMGLAYAGKREVRTVEINIDDGPWMPVGFSPGERGCWVAWQIDWTPPAPAEYVARVRATDSTGLVQSDPRAIILRVID